MGGAGCCFYKSHNMFECSYLILIDWSSKFYWQLNYFASLLNLKPFSKNICLPMWLFIYSVVTETSGCKHVLNVPLHPNGFCVWCVWSLSILFSFKLNFEKGVPIRVIRLVCVRSSPPFPLPSEKKLRSEYDISNLLVASKPEVWSNECFVER